MGLPKFTGVEASLGSLEVEELRVSCSRRRASVKSSPHGEDKNLVSQRESPDRNRRQLLETAVVKKDLASKRATSPIGEAELQRKSVFSKKILVL